MPTDPDRKIRRPVISGQTGPRTSGGKATFSRNSMAHGCRAGQHCIIPGETQQQFEAMRQRWLDEYGPTNALDIEFLERVAEADSRRERCARQLAEVECTILSHRPNPFEWTDDDHRALSRIWPNARVPGNTGTGAESDWVRGPGVIGSGMVVAGTRLYILS